MWNNSPACMQKLMEGTIKEPALELRPLKIDDIDFMVRLVLNPEVRRYLPGMITDRQMMENWIKGLGCRDHEFIVQLGDVKIGECSLTVSTDHSAEIGSMLLPEYWGHGYGTEVVRQLSEKAHQLSSSGMVATTCASNVAAIKLLMKTGFKKQNIGWMLTLTDDGDGLSGNQTVIQFMRKM